MAPPAGCLAHIRASRERWRPRTRSSSSAQSSRLRPTDVANRKNRAHSEIVRSRIRSSQLVNRLQAFIMGKKDRKTKRRIELSPHQVTAALGLLRKTIPDIQSIEHLGEVTARVH